MGFFILRRQQPQLKRPYKIPGYPWPPILAIVGALFIVITTTVSQPILAMIGILLTLSGEPVYLYVHRSVHKTES